MKHLWTAFWGIIAGFQNLQYRGMDGGYGEWRIISSEIDYEESFYTDVRVIFSNGHYVPLGFFQPLTGLKKWVINFAAQKNLDSYDSLKKARDIWYDRLDKKMCDDWPWPDGDDELVEVELPDGRKGVQVFDYHESNLGDSPGGFKIDE